MLSLLRSVGARLLPARRSYRATTLQQRAQDILDGATPSNDESVESALNEIRAIQNILAEMTQVQASTDRIITISNTANRIGQPTWTIPTSPAYSFLWTLDHQLDRQFTDEAEDLPTE